MIKMQKHLKLIKPKVPERQSLDEKVEVLGWDSERRFCVIQNLHQILSNSGFFRMRASVAYAYEYSLKLYLSLPPCSQCEAP